MRTWRGLGKTIKRTPRCAELPRSFSELAGGRLPRRHGEKWTNTMPGRSRRRRRCWWPDDREATAPVVRPVRVGPAVLVCPAAKQNLTQMDWGRRTGAVRFDLPGAEPSPVHAGLRPIYVFRVRLRAFALSLACAVAADTGPAEARLTVPMIFSFRTSSAASRFGRTARETTSIMPQRVRPAIFTVADAIGAALCRQRAWQTFPGVV